MRQAIAKLAGKIAKFMSAMNSGRKKITKMAKKTLKWLFVPPGQGGGVPQFEEEDVAEEPEGPSMEDAPGLPDEMTDENDPFMDQAENVQKYMATDPNDLVERNEIAGNLKPNVRQWCMRLGIDGNSKAIIANCSTAEIANHISGIDPIPGVVECGLFTRNDPMPNPFGKRVVSNLIDEMATKPEAAARVLHTPDVGLWSFDTPLSPYEQSLRDSISKYEAIEQRTADKAAMEAEAYTPMAIGGPRPPRRVTVH